MNTWTPLLLNWLADFYLLATALLFTALLAGTLIRQPIKRYFITGGAVVGLALLAMLCAMPLWPRWFFIRHTTAVPSAGPMIAAASPLLPPAETDIPFPVRPPLFAAAKPPAEGALPVVRHSIPQTVTQSETPSPAGIDLSTLIAMVFIFGAGIVTIWLTIGALRIRWLCRRAQSAPDFAVQELGYVVGKTHSLPRLLISHLIDIAAAWGLWRPTILLPASVLAEFGSSPAHPLTPSPAHVQESGVRSQESDLGPSSIIVQRSSLASSASSLRMLLAHEWAHIRRGDLWLLAASRLLLIVLFAHPLYWLLRRRLRFDQELLADALAAQICGRQEYAECLFNWARQLPNRRMFPAGALGIWNRPGQLSRRIAMLLDERIRLQSACSTRWRLGAAGFVTALVVGLSLVTIRNVPIAKAQPPVEVQSSENQSNKEAISTTSANDAELLRRVVNGIKENYAELKTVQGTIELLDVDPRVDRPTTKTYNLDNGGIATTNQVPALIEHQRFTLKGDGVRVDASQLQKDVWKPDRTIIRRGDSLTVRNIENTSNTWSGVDSMPGFAPMDPREFGGIDVKRGLLVLLQQGRIVEVLKRNPLLQVRLEFGAAPHTWRRLYTFDPSKNFLPVAIVGYLENGRIVSASELSYDEVIPARAWFLRQMTEKFFGQPGAVDPTTAAWTQMIVHRVLGEVQVNQDVNDDAFTKLYLPSADAKENEQLAPSQNPPAPIQQKPEEPQKSSAKESSEKVSVIGTCVDENQRPVANARVRLFRIDHSNTPVNYPSGRMKCQISPGFGDVPAGEQLVYGQGLYLPSSQRVLQETRSDEKGEFRFTSLSIDQSWRENRDVVFVIAQVPGKASTSRQVTINKNNDRAPLVSPLSVTMLKAGVLRGRVTNAADQSVAGAVVWKPGELSLYKPVPGVACATTDANGRYEIDDLYPFVADDLPPLVTSFFVAKYISSAVSVQHPDFADGVIEYTKLPATADASLQAPATLAGRILVDDGREPAVNASVQVSLDDGAGLLVRADDAGRFIVPRLRPGKWRVSAWNAEHPAVNQAVDLHAGENQLELRLQKGGTIKGRIVDAATGKSVVDPHSCASVVTAVVMGRDAHDACQGSMNIDDGTFSIVARPGKNLIGLVNPFWKLVDEERWKTAGIEVAAGQTVEIELRLIPQVAPPPRLPQEPLNEKAVITALKSNGGGVNTETIDGVECVTEIYTIGCDETGARSLGLPPIGWLEKNVLLNIKKFPKLRTLGLTSSGGGDAALVSLRGVESLETLCIGGDPDVANQTLTSELTMAAFDHFATLPNLKMLYVISPHFDDRAFGYLDRWPRLEGLELGGSFTSVGMKQLHGKSKLKQLGIVAMGKTKMGDECLDEIGALVNLEGLSLSDADEANPHHWTVTDDGLAKLAGLTKLSSLTLQCPQITNAGLVHLRGMKNLTHLDLKGTAVTQEGIDELMKSLPKLNATGYSGWKPAVPKAESEPMGAHPELTPGEQPNDESAPITAKAGGAIQAK